MALIEPFIDVITGWIAAYGYLMIGILMTLESALIPIPSEITMPFGGLLSSQGKLNFWLVVLTGATGNLIGSLLAYALGYYGGRPLVLKYGKYILMPEAKLHAAERFFDRYGEAAVFLSRNLPVIRTFISLPVGVAEMNVVKFGIYTFAGSIPWCILMTYIGVFLGNNWKEVLDIFHQIDYVIISIILLAVAIYVFRNIKKRNGNNNGRNGNSNGNDISDGMSGSKDSDSGNGNTGE